MVAVAADGDGQTVETNADSSTVFGGGGGVNLVLDELKLFQNKCEMKHRKTYRETRIEYE